MAVYKRDIADINLETGNIHRTFLNHSIGLKDQKADHFGVRVFRDGEPVNLSGVSVQGVFMPPQGSPIAITSGNIVSGNVAEVVLPQACYNYDGQFCLAIKLVDATNSVTGTVRIVDGMVDNTHASGTVAPTSAVPTYQEVLSVYEQAIAAISTVNAMAGKMAVDITAGAEATSNNSFKDLGNRWMTFRRGYYSTPSAGSTSSYTDDVNYVYALVACAPGDVLHAHGYGDGTSKSAWAFLDSSLKILDKGGSGNYEGATDPAPTSTAFALVNVKLASLGSGYYGWTGPEAIKDQIATLKDAVSEDGNIIYSRDLKSALNGGYIETNKTITWSSGYIDSQGVIRSSSVSGYAIVPLNVGEVVKVGTNNNNITIIGTTTANSLSVGDSVRVEAKTSGTPQFEEYTYTAVYPINVVLCVKLSDYKVSFYKGVTAPLVSSDIETIKSELSKSFYEYVPTVNGSAGTSGTTTNIANRIRTDIIPITIGDVITIENGTMQHAVMMWNNTVSSANNVRNDNSFSGSTEVIKSAYNGYIVIVFRKSDNSNITPSNFDGSIKKYPAFLYNVNNTTQFFKTTPITFEDGKYYSVTYHTVSSDSSYKLAKLNVSAFRGGNITGQTSVAPNSQYGIAFVDSNDGFIIGYSSTNTGHYEFAYNVTVPENATYFYLSCRKTTESQWIDPVYPWDSGLLRLATNLENAQTINNDNVLSKTLNARHIKGNSDTPLTILHFSDLHGDKNALSRIMKYAGKYGTNVDEVICTGDMVPGEAEQITSWWDENVLTCIGNHDTADYEGGTYDWTALSMADRDAYYIAPFESNWGITHTSGTSYYYKDYATQKVRLIVMDGMLYTDNGAEATAQTAWLVDLLADTLDSEDAAYGYHVLIAIHAPHGGATAEECSFSRYGQTEMPSYADCNTPQAVIDAVAAKITAGMKFIGYLVGHTHQDNVWDAEGDGTQLMYCITCAAVATQANQWKNSDQHRDEQHDAFNLVTIDTTNTLIKIVRGGGADIDDHMRTRKAICFNYSTGTKVGEVL